MITAFAADDETRKELRRIAAALLAPYRSAGRLFLALCSPAAWITNQSAVLLCFHGGDIPDKTPAEYVAYIEDMRQSFTLLDNTIAAINNMTEDKEDSLDAIRVKAVFVCHFLRGGHTFAAGHTGSSWTAS